MKELKNDFNELCSLIGRVQDNIIKVMDKERMNETSFDYLGKLSQKVTTIQNELARLNNEIQSK